MFDLLRVNARQAATIRCLREALVEHERVMDAMRHELAVQKQRARRWRRTAKEIASRTGNPDVLAIVQMQGDSDDIADLDETEERNAGRP